MGREIPDEYKGGDFHPMVGLRNIGDYVKGEVVEKSTTANGNPAITLKLLDMSETASASKSVAKGQYEEVSVGPNDLVQVIGSVKQLKEKLPKLNVGEVVTITFKEEVKVPKGKLKKFSVLVD